MIALSHVSLSSIILNIDGGLKIRIYILISSTQSILNAIYLLPCTKDFGLT